MILKEISKDTQLEVTIFEERRSVLCICLRLEKSYLKPMYVDKTNHNLVPTE